MILSTIDRFNLSTGSIGTTQARTGYGQSPKFIFGVQNQLGQSSDLTITQDSILSSVGFAIPGITMSGIAYKSSKSTGSVTSGISQYTDAVFGIQNQAGGSIAINGKWDISSFDSDGITIRVADDYTFDTEIPSAQILALGGPAFSAIALGSFTLSEPGAVSTVTSPGFTPDGILMIAPAGGGGISIGAAVRRGATLAAVTGMSRDNGSAPRARSYTRYGECVAVLGTTTQIKTGTLTNWLSNGFEVTSTSGGTSRTVYFAAFRMAKGFDCRILTGTTSTDGSPIALTTSGRFLAKAGILASSNKAQSAAGVSDANSELSLGMYQNGGATLSLVHRFSDLSENSGDVASAISSSYLNIGSSHNFTGRMTISSLSLDSITGTMNLADEVNAAVWSLAFGSVPVPRGGPLFF